MSGDSETRELFPDLDAAGALRAAFRQRAPAPEDTRGASAARIAAQAERRGYERQGELARGGMGVIVKAFDRGLERDVALKVLRDELARDPRSVQRFLEEAQVTGHLEHPSIVPVHELGLDGEGRVFFAMKLVMGRDLRAIFELVFAGTAGWNETRALSVILKVCEAMAYAHEKGVIHRDLKPANVMVGDFGEVYVMDWGLARVFGRRDTHDIRLKGETPADASDEPRAEVERTADSPLVTMDGDVVGTPAYMPPEQARGEIEELGPRSDVYSIGAMLYHLLARRMPYVEAGASASSHEVLHKVRGGAPTPLSELRHDIPAELVAITERAMEREGARRYRDTLALAEDLRAYLEHRVVKAYQTGALVELRKWVERNKALAAASAAAVLALACGLVASLVLKAQSDRNAVLAQDNADMAQRNAQQAQKEKERAEENAERARASEQLATERADAVLRLSTLQDLDDLTAEADRLWPPNPEMVPHYEAWLVRAQAEADELPMHEAKLLELRARALPSSATRAALPRGDRASGEPDDAAALSEWSFADIQDKWWHNQLTKLVVGLEAFSDPESGLFSSGISPEHGWGVLERLEFARAIEERSVSGTEARARWSEATASIGDEAECPMYAGLALAPQLGLLPIGRDPESGLWEFAHLQSGDPAERGLDGRLVLEEEMGIVLVLIPGGTFWMGAQGQDPKGRNFDARAMDDEGPVHEVELSPYFLSKFEMTQGQWLRSKAENPSVFGPERYDPWWDAGNLPWTSLHPVEQVSWSECVEALARASLALPTEAQWEYACRAGTSSAFWTGDAPESLADAANLSDSFAIAHGSETTTIWEEWLDDGQSVHGPIGAYRANPFGLHDLHGNVWEWCRDGYDYYETHPRAGDGEHVTGSPTRVYRGGSFSTASQHVRSAFRFMGDPEYANDNTGVRPARGISP